MPELPEVEIIARELHRAVRGQKILSVETSWSKLFNRSPGGFARARRELVGKTIKKAVRLGKRIFVYLSGDILWVTHLKMTGGFLYRPQHSNSDGRRSGMLRRKHVRAEFRLSRGTLYFSDIRKFGRMIVGRSEVILKHKDIISLAPDPFQISPSDLAVALKKKIIPIKQALLDQKIISGIGNIYADEILWAAKIHPLTPARDIGESSVKSIISHGQQILKNSIVSGGTSMRDFRNTKGEEGGYLALCNVYGREGKKCRRNCGAHIIKITIGARSARFCPRCQKI